MGSGVIVEWLWRPVGRFGRVSWRKKRVFRAHTATYMYIYICAHFPASAFGRGAMDGGDGGIGDGVVVVVVVDTQRFHGRTILSMKIEDTNIGYL